jgi:hypothetical protein
VCAFSVTACTTDGDASATAIREDPAGGMAGRSGQLAGQARRVGR